MDFTAFCPHSCNCEDRIVYITVGRESWPIESGACLDMQWTTDNWLHSVRGHPTFTFTQNPLGSGNKGHVPLVVFKWTNRSPDRNAEVRCVVDGKTLRCGQVPELT